MKKSQLWILALLALAACGRPAAVSDLKTSLEALKSVSAGNDQDDLKKYQALLADARSKFAAAKGKLSADEAAATATALDRTADAELVWRYTSDIADGLTPWVEPPLIRLQVVKNDAGFQQLAASFIGVQQSVDDDTPGSAAEKEKTRDEGRQQTIQLAMDAADQLITKAEAGL